MTFLAGFLDPVTQRTMVAIRTIEMLGASVGWQGTPGIVTVTGQHSDGSPITLEFTLGPLVDGARNPSPMVTVNGAPRDIATIIGDPPGSVAPLFLDGTNFLPVRVIFELFDIDFEWMGTQQQVFIPAQ